MIPRHTKRALDLWVQGGIPHPGAMGSFFRSILLHDLMGAVWHADDENGPRLREVALYVYNEVPARAHGSMEALEQWHARGGMRGKVA